MKFAFLVPQCVSINRGYVGVLVYKGIVVHVVVTGVPATLSNVLKGLQSCRERMGYHHMH